MSKSDWDESYMISKSKICIHMARDWDLAHISEEDLLKISTNFFFVTDKGLVEIISLHRKWKNEKTKNIVLFPNRLQRELCFSKCKISLCLAFLEFRPQKMKKSVSRKSLKIIIFLLVFMWIAWFKLHFKSEYDKNVCTKYP